MGLTSQSTGAGLLDRELRWARRNTPQEKIIALAGNPNVGKSTVFNNLTGLNQHTGNWPGKTVTNAQGKCRRRNLDFIMVDIPGTYSLLANSLEEAVARDFVCFGNPDAILIVTDATCLERNLNLVLQTLEITDKVVVCVNLMDEARRKKIDIDLNDLSKSLGVPVIATSAPNNQGLDELMDAVYEVANQKIRTRPIQIDYAAAVEDCLIMLQPKIRALVDGKVNSRWVALRLLEGDQALLESLYVHLGFNLMNNSELQELLNKAQNHLADNGIQPGQVRELIAGRLVRLAEEISRHSVTFANLHYNRADRRIDSIITSRIFGLPIMLALLSLVFWITIAGANIPSEFIASYLFSLEDPLTGLFIHWGLPGWLHGILVLGMYRTLAWVVSVMLPPMAIFFPLFTLLEDLGYLPRIAFNLDHFFKKACAHGKQALTMCMGFGCNAAGVIGCRIIESPRERLIATLTNVFVPCNGRFPTLIVISGIFLGGTAHGIFSSVVSTLTLSSIVLLGILMTLLVARILSRTVLKGLPSSFTLELPPYRKPRIANIIVRSVLDRTIFVLGRAVSIAAPAGMIIWLMANLSVGDISLLAYCAQILDPFGRLLGMDGYILMAFILGLPANEIVIPILIMSYLASGSILELNSLAEMRALLQSHGWTWLTGVCVMLFSLMHFPCGTTLLTIKKETQSLKWTLASFIIPTAAGIIVCFLVANGVRLLGLV